MKNKFFKGLTTAAACLIGLSFVSSAYPDMVIHGVLNNSAKELNLITKTDEGTGAHWDIMPPQHIVTQSEILLRAADRAGKNKIGFTIVYALLKDGDSFCKIHVIRKQVDSKHDKVHVDSVSCQGSLKATATRTSNSTVNIVFSGVK